MALIWRVAELFLLIIAVMATMAFFLLLKEEGAAHWPALVIAILSAVGVYFADKHIKRIAEPKPITLPPDFRGPLRVYRNKKRFILLSACAVLFLAAAPFSYEHGKYAGAIFAGLMGSLALLALLSDLRSMGIPYLILDDQGITTREYGRIPWSDVDNAFVHEGHIRGSKSHVLALSVYEPAKYVQRMGPLQRLLRIKWLELPSERDQLRFTIDMLSAKPPYIGAVVKHLRAQYSRSIGVTPKTGDLSIDKRFMEADRLMDSLKSEHDLAKIRATMAKVDGLMVEARQEIQDIRKKGLKSAIIMFIVFFVFFGLYVARKFLGK